MSQPNRRYKGENTHLFDGLRLFEGAGIIIVVLCTGAAALLYRKSRVLFWWAWRLHFLGQQEGVLRSYGIHNSSKERTHARLTGICFFLAVVLGGVGYFRLNHEELGWFFLALPCAMGFIFLTIIFYLNRRDNPVAHSLEVGGDE